MRVITYRNATVALIVIMICIIVLALNKSADRIDQMKTGCAPTELVVNVKGILRKVYDCSGVEIE